MSEWKENTPEQQPVKVLLLALDMGRYDMDRSMDELSALAEANNMEAVAQIVQKRGAPEAGTVLGIGKLEEAKLYAMNLGAEAAIFDGELTGSQIRNLSEFLEIEVLDRTIKGGERILDVGTGSGILGIASCILGAKEAEGVDIDPTAVKVAMENAQLNGVDDRFTVKVGDLSEEASGKYDIVVANIVANAIMMLSKNIPEFLKEGGLYITSGIIIDRKDEVLACLENLGFKILKVHTKNNWVCIEATI